ncbi:MAG TPA: SIMPL domain-containing protein [Candidatus Paceibacterota bacterium]
MEQNKLYKAGFVLLIILSAYFGIRALAELKTLNTAGNKEANTITLSGHGEVSAVPDIAGVYFTVESSKATQAASSDEVNTKTKKILDFLKSNGVAEKDIKTEGYNSYPKYSNGEPCPLYYVEGGMMPPCRTESKIVGYTVSQSVSVKIRKVDDASKIIDGINKIGVSNMSGPNFTIDDEDALKAEARKKAIAEAKTKAEILADDLGVRLGRVTSFTESGNGIYPMMYAGKATLDSAATPVPELPKGENTISSDVTITYEIR